jgi:predicted Rossmann fold flavoprotein
MGPVFDLAVVGGGAAGLIAGISAARRGAAAVVLERMPRAGKKLLATGGGRANLLNDGLSASSFTSTDPALVSSVLERFGGAEIRGFFEGIGLRLLTDETGRVYPATNQASSVLRVLELECARRSIVLEPDFEVDRVDRAGGAFTIIASDGRKVGARSVVLAGGGKSYPALGSNGSCFELAGAFGHRIITPVPSAVPLVVRDRMCHVLQGQKLRVRATSRIDGRAGQASEGELLFTQYGLSGTAILDVSEGLSVALNREHKKEAAVVVDLLPFLTEADLTAELARRMDSGWAEKDLTTGLLPDKFSLIVPQLLREAGPADGKGRTGRAAAGLAAALKARTFLVTGTRGWNEAEFTAGGVDAREVKRRTLESKLCQGIYFAGEVLDVQGGRGGYNLAWAWASGFVAGLAE